MTWLPGRAVAGTSTLTGPTLPLDEARARPITFVPKRTVTPSEAPKPVPLTFTRLVGGPADSDRETLAIAAVALAGATAVSVAASAAAVSPAPARRSKRANAMGSSAAQN